MRYMPSSAGAKTSDGLEPAARPDLAHLPDDLAALLLERDQIRDRRAVAVGAANELRSDTRDVEARLSDDAAATSAARSGRPIPPAKAGRKLVEDRRAAERSVVAYDTALNEITVAVEDAMSKHYWERQDAAAAARAAALVEVEVMASQLADLVEARVEETSVSVWLKTGLLHRRVETWPVDVCDLARFGLDRGNTSPITVRSALRNAATAALLTEEE
jgi:hypothetical protein